MRPERHVIQQRDDGFVAELFREHGEHLTRHLTRILGSTELARDAVQDTYERLLKLQFETIQNPTGYMFQVGVRFALMHQRRAKVEAQDVLRRIPLEDDADNIPGPETLAAHDQNIRHLKEQISALNLPLRQVLELRCVQGMKASEVMKQLGISAITYGRRLTAAKRRLRKGLHEAGVDPEAL